MILGDSGAGRTGFHVIKSVVSKCATNGLEDDNVVFGGVQVNDHCREE